MRAVVDPNVVVAGLLAPDDAPAALLRSWLSGAFELLACPRWVMELEQTLADRRLHGRVTADETLELLEVLRGGIRMQPDPTEPPPLSSPDPDADYVIALAAGCRVALVSSDPNLLQLRTSIPVHTPDEFVRLVETLG